MPSIAAARVLVGIQPAGATATPAPRPDRSLRRDIGQVPVTAR
jgi:hypothetical protein